MRGARILAGAVALFNFLWMPGQFLDGDPAAWRCGAEDIALDAGAPALAVTRREIRDLLYDFRTIGPGGLPVESGIGGRHPVGDLSWRALVRPEAAEATVSAPATEPVMAPSVLLHCTKSLAVFAGCDGLTTSSRPAAVICVIGVKSLTG